MKDNGAHIGAHQDRPTLHFSYIVAYATNQLTTALKENPKIPERFDNCQKLRVGKNKFHFGFFSVVDFPVCFYQKKTKCYHIAHKNLFSIQYLIYIFPNIQIIIYQEVSEIRIETLNFTRLFVKSIRFPTNPCKNNIKSIIIFIIITK